MFWPLLAIFRRKTTISGSYFTYSGCVAEPKKKKQNKSKCIFQLTQLVQPHYAPGVDSASNSNEYQAVKGGRPALNAKNLTAILESIVKNSCIQPFVFPYPAGVSSLELCTPKVVGV
jgi:hypothetical protein